MIQPSDDTGDPAINVKSPGYKSKSDTEHPFLVDFSQDGTKVVMEFPMLATVEFSIDAAKDLRDALNEMLPPGPDGK